MDLFVDVNVNVNVNVNDQKASKGRAMLASSEPPSVNVDVYVVVDGDE